MFAHVAPLRTHGARYGSTSWDQGPNVLLEPDSIAHTESRSLREPRMGHIYVYPLFLE